MQREGRERQIPHFDSEPCRLRKPGLFKGDVAPKCGLDREALAPLDAFADELLVLEVHLLTNLCRYADVRSAIQLRCPIIGVEESHAKAVHGKCGRLAAAWGPATTIILGAINRRSRGRHSLAYQAADPA